MGQRQPLQRGPGQQHQQLAPLPAGQQLTTMMTCTAEHRACLPTHMCTLSIPLPLAAVWCVGLKAWLAVCLCGETPLPGSLWV